MQRLAGSDSGFLFIESPSQTATCVDLVVLAPPADGRDAVTLPELRAHIAARLHLVPALRRRVEPVPLEIGHPVWVDDPDFDLDYHLRSETLPTPGGDAELDALVARALPGRLDRRHPLWQVILVDGLAHGRQALVFRFHHCLADGAGLINTMGRLLDPGNPLPPPESVTDVAALPSGTRLFLTTLLAQLRAWAGVPALFMESLRRFRAVDDRREIAAVPVPRPTGDAPSCRLNRSADAERVFARTRVPLADLRAVKAAAGTSLSDVVLTVVAGGLRSYLLARDELPPTPLVVNVPVGNDAPGDAPRQSGNVFANYFSYLPTDVAEPVERIAAVTEYNTEARLQLELLGRHTLPEWIDRIPPALAGPASRAIARRRRAGKGNPDFSVLVSNVPAAIDGWALGNRTVESLCMTGPVADGAGLNITLTGSGDMMHIALVANPAAVDRPGELASHLEDALAELVAAYEPVAV